MSYYYNNYRRQHYTRNNRATEEEILEYKILSLKKEYGDNFRKPLPPDFGLDEHLIRHIDKYNKNRDVFNKKVDRKKIALTIPLTLIAYTLLCLIVLKLKIFSINETFIFIFVFILIYSIIFIPQIIHQFISRFFIYENEHVTSPNLNNYRTKLANFPSEEQVSSMINDLSYLKARKKHKDYWFSLSGLEFENEMTYMLKKYNYTEVLKTKSTGDGGVDIILTKKDGSQVYVECKAHKKPIGPAIVRSLFGVMKDKEIENGAIISLGGITKEAQIFAERNNIKVWTIDNLVKQKIGSKPFQSQEQSLFYSYHDR